MIYLELFWSFFQVGLFSIGGGCVVVLAGKEQFCYFLKVETILPHGFERNMPASIYLKKILVRKLNFRHELLNQLAV